MKKTALILWIVATCITLLPLQSPAGGKKKKEKVPEAEKAPPEYYVVQTFGFFDDNSVAILDRDGMLKSQEIARQRNRTISAAYKASAEQWSLQELGTIEQRLERKKKKKKKGEKEKKARPFVMRKPSLMSLKIDGPFEDKSEAEARKADCDSILAERQAKAAMQEESRLNSMSDNVSKSYKEKNALKEQQIQMFLAEVDSRANKNVSGLLAADGVKRMGGKITPLVRNQHSMRGTAVNAQNATKVDPRAVKK